MIKTKVAFLEG